MFPSQRNAFRYHDLNYDIPGYFCDEASWTWQAGAPWRENPAEDKKIYPIDKGRRHSFPPPSSYSFKNQPRWDTNLPHKMYTDDIPSTDTWLAHQDGQVLPDGAVFDPPHREDVFRFTNNPKSESPEREGGKYEEPFKCRGWERQWITRRMSGSLEGIHADTATAKNPAFVTRYRAPREPAPSNSVIR